MIDRVLRGLTQCALLTIEAGDHRLAVQADEPLRRGEEDHRVVAAPAVRVLVRERLPMPETPAFLECFLDIRIRIEDALAAKQQDGVEEMSAGTHGRVDLEAVLLAGQEVVGAVARSRMHRAGALLERDVVGQHAD